MADYSTLVHTHGSEARHQCLIYNGAPSQKLSLLAGALKNKLAEGYRCLYLNSAPMVAGMRSTLAAMDVDVAALVKDRLILSSDTVSSGRNFDSEVMLAKLEDLLIRRLTMAIKGCGLPET